MYLLQLTLQAQNVARCEEREHVVEVFEATLELIIRLHDKLA